MRVLITGAGGMIGRKVAERLLRDGHLGGRGLELHPEQAGDPHAAQARFEPAQGAFLAPPRSAVVFVEPRR